MINFGYSIQRDNQIDFDQSDLRIFRKVKKMEPTLQICISCGTCSATCSAAKFTDFSLRIIIQRIARGQVSGLKKELDKCMLCGKCQLACPRGVNTRNVILSAKTVIEQFGS